MKNDDISKATFYFKFGLIVAVIIVIIHLLPPLPKVVNIEHFKDTSATVVNGRHRANGTAGIIVSTKYGEYEVRSGSAYYKYNNQKGKQITVDFERKTYDNGETTLYAYEIEDN